MTTINIITLGCSKNTVDSERLAGLFTQTASKVFFDRAKNDCDVVIVNTCGFIGDAKAQSVDELLQQASAKRFFNRRHARDGRYRRLVAVGCLVERYRDELSDELPEVDAWFGVHQWDAIAAWVLDNDGLMARFDEAERLLSTPCHYAYLKISEGCDRHCSYCAIPNIRGRHISRPIDQLVDEAKMLVRQGVKEIILIAQDTTYYGLDLYGERRLGTLLARLAQESGACWIRLHYTYPASFPSDAIEAMCRYDNICKYIDIPLQHISSRILSSMRRGIDRQGTLDLIDYFRRTIPNVSIRTTLIVGYPGETDEEFRELKDFVAQARFDRMGCFAYSPEEGTEAFRLPDTVSDEEKQHRVDELMELQEQIALHRNEAMLNQLFVVIIDRVEDHYYVGRTQYDSPDVDDEVLIEFDDDDSKLYVGEFYKVRIVEVMEHDVFAHVVDYDPVRIY